jgi:hypothetical protein
MKPTLVCLLTATIALAGFSPNIRVDHENRATNGCFHAALTVGPPLTATQPVYVVIQDDSMQGMVTVRSDITLQKSTDAGTTWLPADMLIRRGNLFACYPDVTTDSDGDVYVVYTENDASGIAGHIYCVRSSDGGATWTAPARIDDNSSALMIGWARVTADSAGNLFAAWNQKHDNYMRIFSSVSTDDGTTWGPRVRVDDDTVPSDCYHTDVAVQPGTGSYLVASTAPYWVRPGNISSHAYLYRSTDMGQTFEPGVQLDTFDYYTGQPHVVADREHIICDYTGSSQNSGNQNVTEARTLYTQPDTWGPRTPVTDLDTLYSSYYNGAKLVLSADGRVHTALMVCDLVGWQYGIYYAFSSDHGATWSDREPINDVSSSILADPDIGADSAGNVFSIWQDARNNRNEIWFSTNCPLGVAEGNTKLQTPNPKLSAEPSVFRDRTSIRVSASSLLSPPSSLLVFDPSGRLVRSFPISSLLSPPFSLTWDGRDASGTRCPAGLYVIRYGTATVKVTLLPSRQ